MDARYRVVLTGELLAGHEQEQSVQALAALLRQPAEKVRLVFGRRATPLNKSLDFRGAKEIEQRLRDIGVGCRVEALEQRPPAAFDARELAAPAAAPTMVDRTDPNRVTCPKCGKVQPPAGECSGCGIVFVKYRPNGGGDAPASPASPAPAEAAAPAAPRADLDELLTLYVGSRAETYLPRFERCREKGGYTPGWNWAAFFFSTWWVAYRKMWPWVPVSLGIGLLWYVVPWLSMLLHIGFTVSADYLYYRLARQKVERLAAHPDAETQIALAGGTSGKAVVGLMLATLVVGMVAVKAFLPYTFEEMREVRSTVARDPQIAEMAGTLEGQITIQAFNATALAVHAWRRDGGDLRSLSAERLIAEAGVDEDLLEDGWGNRLTLMPAAEGFLVISAGPDGTPNSADDIPLLFPVP